MPTTASVHVGPILSPSLFLNLTLPTPTHNRIENHLSSIQPTYSTAMTTTAPPLELKTYWCHECDMSVSLTSSPSPSPLLCPQCHTHFLELMDSPFSQNDADSFLHSSSSSLFDVVFQDALLLLTPSPSKPRTTETTLPVITVSQTLLSLLDPNGVVLCAVCKDAISVDEQAKQLPCDHLYHSDCITPWLLLRSSCPLCRFAISEDENEDENEEDDQQDLNGADVTREMMARMSELSEDDFYGLRMTLNYIASRHELLHSNASGGGGDNHDASSEAGGDVEEGS